MTKEKKLSTPSKTILVIVALLVVAATSFWLLIPRTNYQAAVKKCGGEPYIAVAGEYYTPPAKQDTFTAGVEEYKSAANRDDAKYYCSYSDAKAAGYESWTNPDCMGKFSC